MSHAKFKVSSESPIFDKASKATVIISRTAGTFSVRPHHRRRSYALPLSEVALMVMSRVIIGEANLKKAEQPAKKKVYKVRRSLI
jgi:hypothetical protein